MTAPVVVWLERVLADVEREIREEPHDATPDDYGMARCDLAEPHLADDTCTCGLDLRRPIALAAVEADRAIVAEHRPVVFTDRALGIVAATVCCRCHGVLAPPDDDDGTWSYPLVQVGYPCRTVLLVASRHRHRPGYREEWRPVS